MGLRKQYRVEAVHTKAGGARSAGQAGQRTMGRREATQVAKAEQAGWASKTVRNRATGKDEPSGVRMQVVPARGRRGSR